MDLRELAAPEREAAVRLWGDAGLTHPWNDPVADFDRALAAGQSAVLGLFEGGTLAGTVMFGDDGHRGCVCTTWPSMQSIGGVAPAPR